MSQLSSPTVAAESPKKSRFPQILPILAQGKKSLRWFLRPVVMLVTLVNATFMILTNWPKVFPDRALASVELLGDRAILGRNAAGDVIRTQAFDAKVTYARIQRLGRETGILWGLGGQGDDAGKLGFMNSDSIRWTNGPNISRNFLKDVPAARFNVTRVIVVPTPDGGHDILAVNVDSSGFFPAAIRRISAETGEELGVLHLSGHVHRIEIVRPGQVVVHGVSNSYPVEDGAPNHHPAVAFVLDLAKLVGEREGPPFHGSAQPGELEWFGVINPRGRAMISALEVVDDGQGTQTIRFRLTDGRFIWVDPSSGRELDRKDTDGTENRSTLELIVPHGTVAPNAT